MIILLVTFAHLYIVQLESQNSRRLEYELRQLQEKHVREEETLKMEQQSEMKELETIQVSHIVS